MELNFNLSKAEQEIFEDVARKQGVSVINLAQIILINWLENANKSYRGYIG